MCDLIHHPKYKPNEPPFHLFKKKTCLGTCNWEMTQSACFEDDCELCQWFVSRFFNEDDLITITTQPTEDGEQCFLLNIETTDKGELSQNDEPITINA